MKLKSINIENRASLIRLRNLILYKLSGKSTAVNRFIRYELTEKALSQYETDRLMHFDKNLAVSDEVKYFAEMAYAGRFEILGSGFVKCGFEDDVLGILGIKYENKHIASYENYIKSYCNVRELPKYESTEYKPIFWNRDLRCGYVWESKYLDENRCISSPDGADIKSVWELGRLNFLVPFSIYAAYGINKAEKRDKYIDRYKDFIKDFYISNPVGKGVNWVLAMEPSIRISNILLSYDIIKNSDSRHIQDDDFDNLIKRMTYQHIIFIYNNLEKSISGGRSGNHYFTDLTGLIFATGYLLHRNRKMQRIWDFATVELIEETRRQFYPNGGHYEESTGYFRLTAEMLVFASAMMRRRGKNIPPWIDKIISGNGQIASHLKKSNGRFYSFGDCDSGRFIITDVCGEKIRNDMASDKFLNLRGYSDKYGNEEYMLIEDKENLTGLMSCTLGYFGGTEDEMRDDHSIGTMVIAAILDGKHAVESKEYVSSGMSDENNEIFRLDDVPVDKYKFSSIRKIPINKVKCDEIKAFNCEEMGFFIMRTLGFTLLFHYGSGEAGGHSHNDSLHFEYEVDGEEYYKDPGTFSYTGFPEYREVFRCQKSHNVPQHKVEQKVPKDIFAYQNKDYREVLCWGKNGIAALYKNQAYEHIRAVIVSGECIEIKDWSTEDFENIPETAEFYSLSYGMIEKI